MNARFRELQTSGMSGAGCMVWQWPTLQPSSLPAQTIRLVEGSQARGLSSLTRPPRRPLSAVPHRPRYCSFSRHGPVSSAGSSGIFILFVWRRTVKRSRDSARGLHISAGPNEGTAWQQHGTRRKVATEKEDARLTAKMRIEHCLARPPGQVHRVHSLAFPRPSLPDPGRVDDAA